MRYREVAFENGDTGLIKDLPGEMEIQIHDLAIVSEQELSEKDHDKLVKKRAKRKKQ